MKTANAERRELLERRGREVDGADRTAGAGVCDGDGDGLATVGDAHLAAAHGVARAYGALAWEARLIDRK